MTLDEAQAPPLGEGLRLGAHGVGRRLARRHHDLVSHVQGSCPSEMIGAVDQRRRWTLAGLLIVAAVVYFLMVLPLNHLKERRKRGEEAGPAEPTDVELLTEIRDLLRAQHERSPDRAQS